MKILLLFVFSLICTAQAADVKFANNTKMPIKATAILFSQSPEYHDLQSAEIPASRDKVLTVSVPYPRRLSAYAEQNGQQCELNDVYSIAVAIINGKLICYPLI